MKNTLAVLLIAAMCGCAFFTMKYAQSHVSSRADTMMSQSSEDSSQPSGQQGDSSGDSQSAQSAQSGEEQGAAPDSQSSGGSDRSSGSSDQQPPAKPYGDSDGGDTSNFYGNNSGITAKDGAALTLKNMKITTDASGANEVFSYGGSATTNNSSGDGTSVTISDSEITTTGDNAGGIMTTGGGTYTTTGIGSPFRIFHGRHHRKQCQARRKGFRGHRDRRKELGYFERLHSHGQQH